MYGKHHSEATKEKMSKNNAHYWLGKKRAESTIEKTRGKNHWQWKGGIGNHKSEIGKEHHREEEMKRYKKIRNHWLFLQRKNRHRLGISKRYSFKYGGSKPLTPRERRLLRKYNMKKAGKLTIQIIQRVYEDNIKQYETLTCYLCLKSIEFGQDSLEHKIPLSRDGTNKYNNLAIACQKCNSSKGKKTEEEYRKRVFRK